MNPTPAKTYRNSGILAAIGTLVLLLGTATGNGITIFLMALVTLIVITIYSRHGVSKRVLFFMIVAAAIVAFVAVVLICVDLKVTEIPLTPGQSFVSLISYVIVSGERQWGRFPDRCGDLNVSHPTMGKSSWLKC